MPSSFKAIFELDSKGIDRGFSILDSKTRDWAKRIEARNARTDASRLEYLKQASLDSQFSRKAMLLGGGGTGFFSGFLSRSRVAASMLTSVARDSAASLASGAPISQVIAQQAPQVLQAFTFMGISLKALGVYAAGAGVALFAMTKAAEAFQAKAGEIQSRADLGLTLGANRVRTQDLLDLNASRLNPGEAASLKKRLSAAISNQEFDSAKPSDSIMESLGFSNLEKRAFNQLNKQFPTKSRPGNSETVEEAEAAVRARLKEVHITEQQKKNLNDILETARKNRIETLDGAEKERAIIEDKYRKTVQEIEEKRKGLKDVDQPAIQYAHDQARMARDKALASIGPEKSTWSKPDVTERQRIGAFSPVSIQVSLLDVAKKQEEHLREIRQKIAQSDGGF